MTASTPMATHATTEGLAAVPAPGAADEAVFLRLAGPADAASLALVGSATFLEAFTWMLPGPDIVAHCARHHTEDGYRQYLAHPDTRIVLAEVVSGGAPVGYAMLAKPELPSFDVQATDIELKRLYLFSRFRGTDTPVMRQDSNGTFQPVAGLRAGTALLDAAVEHARALGRTRLLLGTHAGNTRAIAFYRKHGFGEAGTRTFQVGTQICSDLIFSRPL